MSDLFTELKRRNVFKVAIAYLVVGWLAIQVVVSVTEPLTLPAWVPSFVIVLLAVGFPIALLFAWAYELTPEGIKKSKDVELDTSITHHTSRKIDFIIIGALVLIIGGMAFTGEFSVPNSKPAPASIAEEALPPSIAVLAFEDFSPDKDQEYFADGISDEILNLLAKTNAMQVSGRTSSFSFKGKDDDIPTIANKLNVGHVLEGSINKSGNKLKITAQLIGADGNHIWSETYKRDLTDIFEIQEEIAAAILIELKTKLLGEVAAPKTNSTTNMEAFDHYLKGMQGLRIASFEGLASARVHFQAAIALDPDYTLAHISLAQAILYQVSTGSVPPEPHSTIAQTMAENILATNENANEAYALMAEVMLDQDNLVGGLEMYEKAKALGANRVEFYGGYGFALRLNGKYSDAVHILRKALIIDPLDGWSHLRLGSALLDIGQIKEAYASYLKATELNPDSPNAWMRLGGIEAYDYANLVAAIKYRGKAIMADPTDSEQYGAISRYYITLQDYGSAQEMLNRGAIYGKGTGYLILCDVNLLARTGQKEAALDLVLTTLSDDSIIHRWNSKARLLEQGVWLHASMGEHSKAEALLLKWLPALSRLQDAPTIQNDKGFPDNEGHLTYHTIKTSPYMVKELAGLYRLMGQDAKADNLTRHVNYLTKDTITGPANRPLTGSEYLHIAQVAALNGQREQALGLIEEAIDNKALTSWRWYYQYSLAFAELHDEPRWKEVMKSTDAEIKRQREILLSQKASQ